MVPAGYSPAGAAVALLEGSNPATSSPSTDPTNGRVAVTFQRWSPAPSDLYRPVAPLPATAGPPSFASQFSLHVPFSRRVSSLFISTASVPLGPGFLFLFAQPFPPLLLILFFPIVYSRLLSLTQDATTNTRQTRSFKCGVKTKGKTEDISQNSGFFEANTYLKQAKEERKKEKN